MANKKISELVAATLPLVGDESFELVQGGVNKKVSLSSLTRITLTADTTYYVATTGNDSTGDGSVGNPWLTIQRAVDHVCGVIDLAFYNVTIQIADGTYTTPVTLKPRVGAGSVTIQGNVSTPANAILSSTSTLINCIAGAWIVQGFTVTTTSGHALSATNVASLSFGSMVFGSVGTHHNIASNGAVITALTNYSVSGGSATGGHWTTLNGVIRASGRTVTITGTPNFPGGWAWCDRALGLIDCFGMTFIGTATGRRYFLQGNSVCFTNGASTTYLPGNSAGSVLTGSQYA